MKVGNQLALQVEPSNTVSENDRVIFWFILIIINYEHICNLY